MTRVLGYVRERVFAYYFGNDSIPADAFRAALRIANIIRNLLTEGTLSASFIPVYAALNERRDKSAARALAGAILGLLLVGSGVVALAGIVLAPAITTLIAAGFDEPRRQLTITLVRILFLTFESHGTTLPSRSRMQNARRSCGKANPASR